MLIFVHQHSPVFEKVIGVKKIIRDPLRMTVCTHRFYYESHACCHPERTPGSYNPTDCHPERNTITLL